MSNTKSFIDNKRYIDNILLKYSLFLPIEILYRISSFLEGCPHKKTIQSINYYNEMYEIDHDADLTEYYFRMSSKYYYSIKNIISFSNYFFNYSQNSKYAFTIKENISPLTWFYSGLLDNIKEENERCL